MMTEWKLIDEFGNTLGLGDKVTTFRGEQATLTALNPPHRSGTSGTIAVRFFNGDECKFHVSVIDAKYIKEEERDDGE